MALRRLLPAALGSAAALGGQHRRSTTSRCEAKIYGQKWAPRMHGRFSVECAARCVSKSLPRKIVAPVRHDCGDDAFFLTDLKDHIVVGVADGVSSWARYGVNPALFAWELMVHCEEAAKSSSKDVVEVLTVGFETTLREKQETLVGSSTACLASLHCDRGSLDVANLGDSGALVVQPDGTLGPVSRKEQQHYFNCPYQLVCLPEDLRHGLAGGDVPHSCDTYHTQVRLGDLLVFATDGFLDNVWKEQTMEVLRSMSSAPVEQIAQRLVEMAYAQSHSLQESPFSASAAKHGFRHRGGKPDDITVLVARIVSGGPRPATELRQEEGEALRHGLDCAFTEDRPMTRPRASRQDRVDWPRILGALHDVSLNYSHSSVMITAGQLYAQLEGDRERDPAADGCWIGVFTVKLVVVLLTLHHEKIFLEGVHDDRLQAGFQHLKDVSLVHLLRSPFAFSLLQALSAYSQSAREACPLLQGPPGANDVPDSLISTHWATLRCMRFRGGSLASWQLYPQLTSCWHLEMEGNGCFQSFLPPCDVAMVLWRVVGGTSSGLVVREQLLLTSAAKEQRLQHGAVVEEVTLIGGRLQYRKRRGQGPDCGWVSLQLKGKRLLETLDQWPLFVPETWPKIGEL
eukprot:g8227.t1